VQNFLPNNVQRNNADQEQRATNNQAFDYDLVEIIPSRFDANCYTKYRHSFVI